MRHETAETDFGAGGSQYLRLPKGNAMLQSHVEEEQVSNLGLTPRPGQSPITPHELAGAIVSVELRQQEKASPRARPSRTVAKQASRQGSLEGSAHHPAQSALESSLEDTIRSLELTVTPQELVTELHAQRAAAHQNAVMTPRKTGRSVSWWLLLTGCVLSTAATLFVSFMLYVVVQKFQELWNDNSTRTAPSSGMRPLSAFNPHDPAYLTYENLRALANGTPPSRIWAAQWSSTTPGAHWGVEQENGRYVVRANSLRDSSGVSAKTEWVSPDTARIPFNYTERIPVERFKHIQEFKNVPPNTFTPPVEQVKIVRGSE